MQILVFITIDSGLGTEGLLTVQVVEGYRVQREILGPHAIGCEKRLEELARRGDR